MKADRLRFPPAALGSLGLAAAMLLACGGEESTAPPPPSRPDPPRATSIAITPASVSVAALGDTVRLTAQVRDQNGRALAGAPVAWASGDPSVATVNASGLVTAEGNGSTAVTATSGRASGAASVAVMQRTHSVAVSPATGALALGDTLRLVAVAFDSNDRAVAGAGFAWSSDRPDIVGVDASGLARGIRDGVAAVTATSGDARGGSTLTVANPDLAPLGALYETTGGAKWANNEGWLGDGAVGEWYGIGTDSTGRIVELDLSRNGLEGYLPPNLGELTRLTHVRVGSNALDGPLPRSLTGLDLVELRYSETELCTPPEEAFQVWLGAIPSHQGTGIECVPSTDRDALEALYRATGGPDWARGDQWLTEAPLGEWHGVEVDGLDRVVGLHLGDNGLSGPIPVELEMLAQLRKLFLHDNDLSGRIPPEFGEMARLQDVTLWNNRLTGRIPPELGSLVRLERLALLGNRLDGPIPPELGNLAALRELFLNSNNLSGPIPPELAGLASLEILEFGRNELHGPIPPALGDLPRLRWLYLNHNSLSGPIPRELGNLTSLERLLLGSNDLADPIPAALGSLASLEVLDLNRNGLSGPIPAALGNLTRLKRLSLNINELSGAIPPELGNLVDLEKLLLNHNELSGEIPAELGRLTNLQWLFLNENELSGEIPRELGNLASLTELHLDENALSGPIPRELGALASVELLAFSGNELSGPLPPSLGNAAGLVHLELDRNTLSGPIPPELGSLSALDELLLDNNDLGGAVPPELGALTGLGALTLSNNEALDGSLPQDLTALGELDVLLAGGTGLCAPPDPSFFAWLDGIRKRRLATCADAPAAYLTQSVQSLEFPVPLVAGEEALLRVFPTAARTSNAGIPPVRARFYMDDQETHVADVRGKSGSIPTEVFEGDLSRSANVEIPGSVVRPGLEIVIEVDPEGTLDPGLGVAGRIPETGRLAVPVEAMPTLELTVTPFLWNTKPDSLVIDLVEAMADDPDHHELLGMTRTLLPVGELALTAHEPVMTSYNNSMDLLRETEAIRVLEGRSGYYLGTMTGEYEGIDGLALATPSRTSVGKIDKGERSELVIVHELGHNMSLQHPEGCEAGEPDYSYPHPGGRTGAWGYDFEAERLVPPTVGDIMSYCIHDWISDYHFTNALRHRLEDEGERGAMAASTPRESLVLWGGATADGVPFLEPAFVIDAPAALPRSGGEYRLTGRAGDGNELFKLSFDMTAVPDGDGSSSFAFVLPTKRGWEGQLANITLTGPGGSATLDGESDLPAAVLRNPRTGQIRGILRELPGTVGTLAEAVAALSPEPGLDVLFSRGIPDAEAWNREERE